ncbi:MAG: carboxymuconolactone decarboxylase family protein [Planctomycetota bacterium]|jgi:alkylhydroperoxidase family enzyme
MAFIRQIDPNEAEGPLKRVYDAAAGRSGGVANIIKVMGLDARSVQASMGFYVSIMKADNALDAARREMLATVVSNINDCYY